MPLRLVWSPLARSRLQQIRAFIAQDKPDAAERFAVRLVAVAQTLATHPYLGRATEDLGVRELVVGGTPFILHYHVGRESITVLTIRHGRRGRD